MDLIQQAKSIVADVERMIQGAQCGDIESREMLIQTRKRMEQNGYHNLESWDSLYHAIDATIRETADNPLG